MTAWRAGVLAAVLASATAAAGVTFATSTAGGADAYGYVSQAELWLRGSLVVEQPWMASVPWPNRRWTLTPLGYQPFADRFAFVPTYPAGLPLLMAGAKRLAGQAAVFWVVPVAGAVLVFVTFLLGLRLASAWTGLAAALLVATSPAVLFMMMAPMADVPVAAAWAAAFRLALGRSRKTALAAGAAASVATLIKPDLVFGSIVVGLWLIWRASRPLSDRPAATRSGAWRRVGAFAAGALPGLVGVAILNRELYGSSFQSGYGDLGVLFAWSHVPANLARYGAWLLSSQTPFVLIGLIAIAVPHRRLWPRQHGPSFIVAAALFVLGLWALYSAYLVFDAWWYLRFLLAGWPFMMIGTARITEVAVARWRWPGWAAASLVIALGVWNVRAAVRLGAFDQWRSERRYALVGLSVRSATPDDSALLAWQHSGSLRYYGGRMTIRFDQMDPEWLDQAVAWLDARGVRAYAVLDESERAYFERRFAGQRSAALGPPIVVWGGRPSTYLYDLSRPPASTAMPVEIDLRPERFHIAAPARAPRWPFGSRP